jgi:hypothetical protein
LDDLAVEEYKCTRNNNLQDKSKERVMLNETLNESQKIPTNKSHRLEVIRLQERRMRRQRRLDRMSRRSLDSWSALLY